MKLHQFLAVVFIPLLALVVSSSYAFVFYVYNKDDWPSGETNAQGVAWSADGQYLYTCSGATADPGYAYRYTVSKSGVTRSSKLSFASGEHSCRAAFTSGTSVAFLVNSAAAQGSGNFKVLKVDGVAFSSVAAVATAADAGDYLADAVHGGCATGDGIVIIPSESDGNCANPGCSGHRYTISSNTLEASVTVEVGGLGTTGGLLRCVTTSDNAKVYGVDKNGLIWRFLTADLTRDGSDATDLSSAEVISIALPTDTTLVVGFYNGGTYQIHTATFGSSTANTVISGKPWALAMDFSSTYVLGLYDATPSNIQRYLVADRTTVGSAYALSSGSTVCYNLVLERVNAQLGAVTCNPSAADGRVDIIVLASGITRTRTATILPTTTSTSTAAATTTTTAATPSPNNAVVSTAPALSTGAIVGVAVGGAAFVVLIIVIISLATGSGFCFMGGAKAASSAAKGAGDAGSVEMSGTSNAAEAHVEGEVSQVPLTKVE